MSYPPRRRVVADVRVNVNEREDTDVYIYEPDIKHFRLKERDRLYLDACRLLHHRVQRSTRSCHYFVMRAVLATEACI